VLLPVSAETFLVVVHQLVGGPVRGLVAGGVFLAQGRVGEGVCGAAEGGVALVVEGAVFDAGLADELGVLADHTHILGNWGICNVRPRSRRSASR
jgi:hypothetical protein